MIPKWVSLATPSSGLVTAILLIVSLGYLIAGIGLLKCKKWARVLSILHISIVAFITIYVITVWLDFGGNNIFFVPLIVLSILGVYFLTHSKVKERFK